MNWNYIAGFFDGEGSLTKNANGYRVSIPQTHKGVLASIQAFTGRGFISEVRKRKAHWKNCWIWGISTQEDVLFFLKGVAPHVIVKKKLLNEVLPKTLAMVSRRRQMKKQLNDKRMHALSLRKQGLSYKRIGTKMSLDHGYVRKMILQKWH